MVDGFQLTVIINLTFLILAAILTLLYLLPIILVRRFHTTNNILTGNVCLASILCCSYWIITYLISDFFPSLLMQPAVQYFSSSYFGVMFNSLLVYSMTIITVNRFVTINYPNKRFFKQRVWPFISSIVQWIMNIILPIPFLVHCVQNCIHTNEAPFWIRLYSFLIIVIFPSVLNVTFNTLIYFSVRSSTRRIHAITTIGNATTKTNLYQHSRDIYLLKHMFVIFVVFILGWTPIYIFPVFKSNESVNPWVLQLFQILPVISSVVIVMDLFLYNHDLRQYLKEKFLNF